MLFNSYVFIFAFLPVTLAGYFLFTKFSSRRPGLLWLTAASLFFYGWWNPQYLLLLLGSMLFNYLTGLTLARMYRGHSPRLGPTLAVGIAVNLLIIAYYKYANFIVDNVAALTGAHFTMNAIVLPLAISFFTFQQIAYLVDASRGETAEYDIIDYCLFVTFYPQLIAGPIVHHKEVMPQFAAPGQRRFDSHAFAEGITFFTAGLFKKVVLADNLAKIADPTFAAAAGGDPVTAVTAWIGIFAYSFQIYFDFSGYSDMAVGLARMVAIRLPYNFNSPYKAVNIIDFWRRWHMTLSRFLRDYLYIPLGGSRRGPARRYVNLLLTMFLGGMWHGAGWTFVIWGGLHGLYLVINHAIDAVRAAAGLNRKYGWLGASAGRLITFVAVTVAWVFFRAPTTDAAFALFHGLTGGYGLIDPAESLSPHRYALMGALLIVVWIMPNTQQTIDASGSQPPYLRWAPTVAWATAVSACLLFSITQLSKVSAFIYFNF
jgi:alginate O-acetyltransferase complex protein AlgI